LTGNWHIEPKQAECLLHLTQNTSPGLYVHVPFCKSKCPYCGFYSNTEISLIPLWLNAFEQELACYKSQFDPFDTVYLGGGTPSILGPDSLARILHAISETSALNPETEFTLEANPADLDDEKTRSLAQLGFNRINLGVQSFDDSVLRFLGRRHSKGEAEKAIEILKCAGFENVGIDLIYGFQDQTISQWLKTLQRALEFQPRHLSCYQLSFEQNTPFGERVSLGLLRKITEKKACQFFLTTSRFLEDHGYIHYEVSNFVREEENASRHNQKYWQHVPYLGLGPSAHSFRHKSRWWNVRSVEGYIKLLHGNHLPVEAIEQLTDEQLQLERLALGLRTKAGIKLEEIPQDPLTDTRLSLLQDEGYLRTFSDRVIPTCKGMLVADSIPLLLLD
jgi:oxygen-independent coproporphyrinogen-3 oxidase